ncbi:MAG: hypothetical protein K6G31_07025 [Paludibacteraceae bacterium]|nr:hypothetical protein [Paludibacteraceae bacterium]
MLFKNDSVVPYVKAAIGEMLAVDTNSVTAEIVNDPPKGEKNDKYYYYYCNASQGVENHYRYTVGSLTGECPVIIKVLDTYSPYCEKDGEVVPLTLEIVDEKPTQLELDQFFEEFAMTEIKKTGTRYSKWNDKMWSHQYDCRDHSCEGSGLKEAHIDWENTDISSFSLRLGQEKELVFQYDLLDKAGNKGISPNYSIKVCRGKIKVKRAEAVSKQCPPETLTVIFEARETGKNEQSSIFKNDSVEIRLSQYLERWLNRPVDNVTVVNNPPDKYNAALNNAVNANKFYTYYNAKDGVENRYSYTVDGHEHTCPVIIKVVDKYHPYCAGKQNENYVADLGEVTVSSSCAVVRDVLDEKFQLYAEEQIFTCNELYEDRFWSHQYVDELDLGRDCGRKVRPAWIEWDSTFAHWTDLGNTGNKKLEIDEKGGKRIFYFYFVYYDENGNRALDPWAKPCRGKVTLKVDESPDVELFCPASYGTFLAGKRVELPYPDVSPNEFVHWENVDLYASDGVNKVNVTKNWLREKDGFYVNMPSSPGDYILKLKGWVCGDGNHVKEIACPVKVIKAETHCNTN